MGEGRGEGKTTAPLSDDRTTIPDNRLKTYNGTTYYYDDLGNLIHRELADGEVQIAVSAKFCRVLEYAGVFKQTKEGQEAFSAFMHEFTK